MIIFSAPSGFAAQTYTPRFIPACPPSFLLRSRLSPGANQKGFCWNPPMLCYIRPGHPLPRHLRNPAKPVAAAISPAISGLRNRRYHNLNGNEVSLPPATRAMPRRADVPSANVWLLSLHRISLENAHQLMADGSSAVARLDRSPRCGEHARPI